MSNYTDDFAVAESQIDHTANVQKEDKKAAGVLQ